MITFDPPTNSRVRNPINLISSWVTATSRSPTGSSWWVNVSESPGADVMGGVCHVEVDHSHPPSTTITALPGHVTVLQTSIASTSILDAVVTTGAIVRQVFAGWGWIEEGTQGKPTTAHLWDYLTKLLGLHGLSITSLTWLTISVNNYWVGNKHWSSFLL